MNTIKKVMQVLTGRLQNRKIHFFIAVLAVISLVSLVLWASGSDKNRYIINFEHMNKDGLYVETRYLPRIQKEDRLRLFVDDMLLGPVGDRYKLLFPRGTTVTGWFIRDKTLYVTLSEEALNLDRDGKDSSQNKEGAEIFRKNVFRNFRNIDIINLYIGGRKIYEE